VVITLSFPGVGPTQSTVGLEYTPRISLTALTGRTSSNRLLPREKKGSRKVKGRDELRPEYKRSDFGVLIRGKYARRATAATNVVVLEPGVTKAFPNDRAVNKALRSVMQGRKASAKRSRATRSR